VYTITHSSVGVLTVIGRTLQPPLMFELQKKLTKFCTIGFLTSLPPASTSFNLFSESFLLYSAVWLCLTNSCCDSKSSQSVRRCYTSRCLIHLPACDRLYLYRVLWDRGYFNPTSSQHLTPFKGRSVIKFKSCIFFSVMVS
jgi:hypothetical protein